MQTYRVRFRNSQGTMIRIMGSVTRRGLVLQQVEARPAPGGMHALELRFSATARQQDQLGREWRAIFDVVDVDMPAAAPTLPARMAPAVKPAGVIVSERAVPRQLVSAG